MVLQILLRKIDFGSSLLVTARRIIPTIFVLATVSSTMVIRTLDSPAMLIKSSSYFALTYWYWYSCQCGLTTSMAARMHIALAFRLKLKLWENLHWYLQVYVLVSILGCLQKSTRLCHERRKNLKTLKI
jgi:hypothetical protein